MKDTISEPTTELNPVDFDPFADGELARTVTATEPQQEIWLSAQMGDDASCAFNESISLRLHGVLDMSALRAAVQELVDRHETLRSSLSSDGVTLCIERSRKLDIPFVDLAALPEADRQAQFDELIEDSVTRPFNLELGPLIRASIIRLGETEHELLLAVHHVACDGWSFGVLMTEIGPLYTARKLGRSVNLPAASSFSDYANQLGDTAGNAASKEDEAYWLELFKEQLPVLDLPYDRPRPVGKSYRASRIDRVLGETLTTALKRTGGREGCSLFVTLLASVEVYLARIAAQLDLAVGIPAAGQAIADADHLVGHCVNLLPLRTRVDSELRFGEYLRSRRGSVIDAYDHQSYTFGSLIRSLNLRRDASRVPLVSVVFNLDQRMQALEFDDLQVEFRCNPRRFENFDLFLNVTPREGTLVLELTYNTDLFDLSTAERRLDELETLMQAIVTDPQMPIEQLSLLPPEQRRTLLQEFGRGALPGGDDQTLLELLAKQVLLQPEAAAVAQGERRLTYHELDVASTNLAVQLVQQDLGDEALIGIYLPRGPELVVAMLGALKAGAAYLPLDPAYPANRVRFMLEDSRSSLVVTSAPLASELAEYGLPLLAMDESLMVPSSPVETVSREGVLAYVIYTSGSTGTPKGVEVTRAGLVNHARALADSLQLSPEDRVLQFASPGFDVAAEEIFPTLVAGACVVIPPNVIAEAIPDFINLLQREQVTVVNLPVAYWAEWVAVLDELPVPRNDELRLVVVGSEAVPVELYEHWCAAVGDSVAWRNAYGVTEATITSTLFDSGLSVASACSGSVPIGHPIAGTQAYILDERQNPVPVGVVGELYLGGAGVARGYRGRPELTAARFVRDPFGDDLNARLYRTGDLAKFLADGNLVFVGRADDQIKLAGYRIEPGEVEACLVSQVGVARATVVARPESNGEIALVAFVTAASPNMASSELIRSLRGELPPHMVPRHIVTLDELPLLPNGKVDKRALLGMPIDSTGSEGPTGSDMPVSDLESKLHAIWVQLLGTQGFGIDDDFFELGGHSLLAIRMVNVIRRELGMPLSMAILFDAPTIAELAAHLRLTAPSLDASCSGEREEIEL